MQTPAEFNLSEAMVQATIARLVQIFGEYGLEITCIGSGTLAYQSLVNQLSEFFKGLMKVNRSRLMQILYRIDISESLLHKTLSENPQMQAHEVMAHLVIKRELQKSITRHYFKKRENPD